MAYSLLGKARNIISHNVNGLNIPEKRTKLLKELKKANPAIVYLQETHFKNNNIPKLTDGHFTKAYHATNPTAKTKGVTILFSKHSPFSPSKQLVDPEGRYIFIKGTWDGTLVTLANVYFPNKAHITFCQKIVDELRWFAEGCIILGGDFNIPLNPQQDTSSGYTSVAYKILKRIKKLLQSLSLVDTWRSTHPSDRDYTFFSSPHKRYSRIDLIFISQRNLINLIKAEIGIISISDHAPTAINFKFNPPKSTSFNWRLNSALLTDQTIQDDIHDSIKRYFETNRDSDTNPLNNWEAHKSVIRGDFIKWGARRKKERDREITNLSNKIASLESQHKQSITINLEEELKKCRQALKQILDLKTRRTLFFQKNIFYEHGNKSGKYLARALKEVHTEGHIHAMKNKTCILEHKPEKIAELFHEFYTALYDIKTQHKPPHIIGARDETIKEFLQNSGLPTLDPEDINKLEEPINITEIQEVIKELKPGKSPGPDGFTSQYYKTFTHLLSKHLVSVYNNLAKQEHSSDSLLMAYIAVVPKPDKDPTDCANFRPISLLNIDLKIFTKILANR